MSILSFEVVFRELIILLRRVMFWSRRGANKEIRIKFDNRTAIWQRAWEILTRSVARRVSRMRTRWCCFKSIDWSQSRCGVYNFAWQVHQGIFSRNVVQVWSGARVDHESPLHIMAVIARNDFWKQRMCGDSRYLYVSWLRSGSKGIAVDVEKQRWIKSNDLHFMSSPQLNLI